MAAEYIYGRHPVLEALQSETAIHAVFLVQGQSQSGVVGDIVKAAQQRSVRVEWVGRGMLERLVEQGANHQGVAAEIPPFRYSSVESILKRADERGEAPLVLLLDGIQDVHNFGALVRTAEAAGMHGVVIPERRAVGVTPTVYKSSAGAVNYMPVAQVTNINQTIKQLRDRGIWFVGLDMAGKQPYHRANLKGPLGIVVGAEGKGLSRLVAEHCDFLVHIPMRGSVESLNASVAGGILIYEAIRQRG